MKLLIFNILLLSAVLTSCSSSTSLDTPEALGKTVFTALQKQDKELFKSSAGNIDEFKALMKKMGKSVNEETATRKVGYLHERIDKGFDKLIEKNSASVDFWKNSTFKKVEVKKGKEGEADVAGISLIFTNGKKEYTLRMSKCFHSDRGWLLAKAPYFRD